jgi:hypothetical protein
VYAVCYWEGCVQVAEAAEAAAGVQRAAAEEAEQEHAEAHVPAW